MNKIVPIFSHFIHVSPKIGVYIEPFVLRYLANQPVNFGIFWDVDSGMVCSKVLLESAFKLGRQAYQIGRKQIFSCTLKVCRRDIVHVLVDVISVPVSIDEGNALPRRLKLATNSAKPLYVLVTHEAPSKSFASWIKLSRFHS